MNLAAESSPWLVRDLGTAVLVLSGLLVLAVVCLLGAVRGSGHSAGARTGLALVAAAALTGEVLLVLHWVNGDYLAALARILPFVLAAAAVGWAVRLARHGAG
ncbi:hypothetical protein ACWEQL_21820 [Kitasatospora sp. NPDC004240]